uniref:F-box domain-containing protein n=1 Tax=Panagrellus redivivus TaxID=6233 RepID=A0A7E4W0K7_PANRE
MLEPTDAVLIVKKLYIRYPIDVANMVFKFLYLKETCELFLVTNGLTVDLLRFFAHQMPNITKLTLDDPQHNVKISEILSMFPQLCKLEIEHSYHNWIPDFLSAHVNNVNVTTYGEDSSFEDIFNFHPEDLMKLLDRKCTIGAVLKESCMKIEEQNVQVRNYLGPAFTYFGNSVPHSCFAIRLACRCYHPDRLITCLFNYYSRALYDPDMETYVR